MRTFDGEDYVFVPGLHADVAFVRAWRADTAGNLVYRMTERNFNPLMAMAAKLVIVEVEEPILPAGAIDPDDVHTPGILVQRLVQVPPRSPPHRARPQWSRPQEGLRDAPDALVPDPDRWPSAWRANSPMAGSSTSASACRR